MCDNLHASHLSSVVKRCIQCWGVGLGAVDDVDDGCVSVSIVAAAAVDQTAVAGCEVFADVEVKKVGIVGALAFLEGFVSVEVLGVGADDLDLNLN